LAPLAASILLAFDDTFFAQAERHVHFISYCDRKLKALVFKLLSLKSACGKDADTNAKLDFDNIIEAGLIDSGLRKHAAMAEGAALGVLLIKHGKDEETAAAAAAGVAPVAPPPPLSSRPRQHQCRVGDEQHKHHLVKQKQHHHHHPH